MKHVLALLLACVALESRAAPGDLPAPISAEEHGTRRRRALESMRSASERSAAAYLVIVAPRPDRFSGDVDYIYRPDNNLFYLTGIDEDGCALILSREDIDGHGNALLFLEEGSASSRVWHGDRLTRAQASARSGIREDAIFAPSKLPDRLRELLGAAGARSSSDAGTKLWYETGSNGSHGPAKNKPMTAASHFLLDTLGSDTLHLDISSPGSLLHPLRQIKSPAEVALMREAIDTTCVALKNAMRAMHPDAYEFELRGTIEGTFLRRGCAGWGFPSIVGSGPNSCILHYQRYRRQILDGDLVLMDVGAEYSCYSADVTRTVPVNGHFSARQRAIYAIVLDAQKAAIDVIAPGVRWSRVNRVVRERAGRGLMELGMISDLREARRYVLHGSSHGLGLAVHDPLPTRTLQRGMVITVEPGIYIPKESLGIRIEDDVLVTENGHEVLSAGAPKEIAEIEAYMATRDF